MAYREQTVAGRVNFMSEPGIPRRVERKSVSLHVVVRAELNQEGVELSGFVMDVSRLGAMIRTGAPLTPGQVIHIGFRGSPEKFVACSIVWVGENGTALEGKIGVAFQEPVQVFA